MLDFRFNECLIYAKSVLRPGSRYGYLGALLPAIAKNNPRFFLASCKALGVDGLAVKYLDQYPIQADVMGKSITEEILQKGSYQYSLMETLAATSQNRDCLFIDIGANIGTTCLNAFDVGFRRFLLFEPVSKNFTLMRRNLKSIESQCQISYKQSAVGEDSGSAKISLHPTSGGRHSLAVDYNGGYEDVAVTNLDCLNINVDGFLWVDAEGYELNVVKGARKYIDSRAIGMCIEISPGCYNGTESEELVSVLRACFSRFITSDGRTWASPADIPAIRQNRQCDVICLKS